MDVAARRHSSAARKPEEQNQESYKAILSFLRCRKLKTNNTQLVLCVVGVFLELFL